MTKDSADIQYKKFSAEVIQFNAEAEEQTPEQLEFNFKEEGERK